MPELIRDGAVVADDWTRLEATEDFPGFENLPSGKLLLPLEWWNELPENLGDRQSELGLWLKSTDLPEDIRGDVADIPVIGVDFPVFTDGRGFSVGRLLRMRYGYTGELRAIGAPIRDQLFYLHRCGFNAFELADHYDPAQALESLQDFNQFYQAAEDEKRPLFRRRLT